MKGNVLEKVLVIAGVAIIITGFMLHAFALLRPHRMVWHMPLGLRTITPAFTYGLTLLLIGICYFKARHVVSIVLMSILLILSNVGYAFVIHDFLTTPYGPEVASEVYSFIAQTLTYPWIIINVAGIVYFYCKFKCQKRAEAASGQS